jgi:hypothetical protein
MAESWLKGFTSINFNWVNLDFRGRFICLGEMDFENG